MVIKYSLYYKDSTGTILDQTGNLPLSKMDKAFHTNSLLIVDGKRVQAIVNIAPSVVFKQMLVLLLASLLMFIIILFCIAYPTKLIFTQHKLNKLREDFTHALTHDMKTPLGSINTVLSNFRSGVLDNNPEKQERFGRIAMDQVANMLLLVEKILTIAKIERGKFILNRAEADLNTTIKELEERFSVSNEKPVTIHSSIKIDDSKIIYIDATLIKNAIANLIDNAIKYSGDSVKIDIDCYLIDNSLYIRVSDNGFGISEKDQRKIFEKFERGSAVGRKGAKGFGLGLTYVKQVTEAHGGLVTIFSHEGKWSEFTITLPLYEPDNN